MITATCVHHWIISQPEVFWEKAGGHGPLVERTQQVCKKCGETKENIVPLALDVVHSGDL